MSRRKRARRPHRTWPQRLLITFNCCMVIVALVGAGSLAYAKRKVSQIDRYELTNINDPTSPGFDSDQPRNFLLVGADSDDGLAADDPARAGRGDVGGIRSDTIMVVRVDPKTNEAKVLSFPRDLWVDVPGFGKGRINSSLEFGGPDKLIETIKTNFDIDINHYVQVNFAGFKSLVDQIGGVPVYFATPVKDQGGLNVTSAGCNTLDGTGALAYVRARHMKYLNENGRWKSIDPTSDLGRISRQQDFIKRVLRGAIKKGARNPRTLATLINTGVTNIRLDQGTTAGDLIALGNAFRTFDPNALQTYNLPVTATVRSGADVLDLQTGGAEPILAQFRGTGTEATGDLTPASIAVAVLNGSGVQNQAGDASSVLATAGFKMSEPGQAAGVMRTQVRYAPGMEAQAALVARHLFADVDLIADQDVAEITVVTGPDFHAALVDPRPEKDFPVPTTTTTTAVPGSESGSTDPDAGSTTTSSVVGYVPGAAPVGEPSCG
ncbi:MAG TPA: LCP family protein [Acidimicrobiales bacterium]|nr:LCP family protein [Acidimicrobiales bacterium]